MDLDSTANTTTQKCVGQETNKMDLDSTANTGDPQWVKRFRQAERPGLYCRVIREGVVRAGEPVRPERYTGETISILEMYREYYNKAKSEEMLHRHLNAPIAIRARRQLEKELHARLDRLGT